MGASRSWEIWCMSATARKFASLPATFLENLASYTHNGPSSR